MKIVLDKGAKLPTRAHPWDGGLDLYAPECDCVPPTLVEPSLVGDSGIDLEAYVGSVTIDTGVHVQIPEGYVGFIKAKSGLNVKHGLTCTGVIDAHYTGSIAVKLYNHTSEPYLIKAGDKIAQLVILPCLLPDLELVDSLEETDRGDAGFGSTGR
jgi:dUTP pyrophosphatase